MATIETIEGRTLIVKDSRSNPKLVVEASYTVDGGFPKELEEPVYSVYALGAEAFERMPETRGDLTRDVTEDLVNRLIGYIVAKKAENARRSDVELMSVTVKEADTAARASPVNEPAWEDDWDPDASKSDKVRFLLELGWEDERIAAVAGCSRSLISGIRKDTGGVAE